MHVRSQESENLKVRNHDFQMYRLDGEYFLPNRVFRLPQIKLLLYIVLLKPPLYRRDHHMERIIKAQRIGVGLNEMISVIPTTAFAGAGHLVSPNRRIVISAIRLITSLTSCFG